MPVYVRKNVFTPPSLDNVSSEEEDDYLQDPELLKDVLPQPYRMIDKIVNLVLDTVWDIISIKERLKIAQESKIRPPRYDCAVEMQPNFNKVTAMTDSVDGRYIFVGLPNSLVVLDPENKRQIVSWEEKDVDITHIKAHIIGVQTYLIVTIDDMGIARIFAFGFDYLFLLKVLNEPDGGTKLLATKCEASVEGDYIGIVLENPGNQETWLDIYKTPRDAWLRELESIQVQIAPKQSFVFGQESNTEGLNVVLQEKDTPEKTERRKSVDQTKRSGSPTIQTAADIANFKFSAPSLVLKVRPPPNITGCSCSLTIACQKVDHGEVIGSGQNHIVTPQHFNQRDKMFNHLHENLLQYMPPKDPLAEENIVMPSFHFLTSGRMMTVGLENMSNIGQPTSVAVWWDGDSHIMHYSLLKTAKDLEHKADLVWPFSWNIKCTAMTPCSSFIAVGLENGTVTVWDWNLGIDQGVICVCAENSIERLLFLDPRICDNENLSYPPYKTRASTYLLIQCKNGSQYLHNTSAGSSVIPMCIAEEPEDDDEHETILETMTSLPEVLLVVEKSGNLILKDVTNGTKLCQLCLPVTYKLSSPWQPIFAFGGGGQTMFIKGELLYSDIEPEIEMESESKMDTDIEKTVEATTTSSTVTTITLSKSESKPGNQETTENDDDDDDDGDEVKETKSAPVCTSQMFYFPLESFPTLDRYWERRRKHQDLKIRPTVEKRLETLMASRWEEQMLRKPRMQMRWKMLREELDLVHLRRDMTNKSLAQTFYL